MAEETIQIIIEGRDRLSTPAANASRSLGGLRQAANNAGGALASIGKMALGFGAAIVGVQMASRAFGAVSDSVIGFNAAMEQSKIGWSTMLGSAEAADVMLRDLQQFAAQTPFEFPELEASSRRLLAMGFSAHEVIPMMTDLGNAAGALGMGTEGVNRLVLALGQMRAKSKVSGEEMRQLAEAGVPAWEILAQAVGKPIPEVMKLSEQGKIAADTFIDAFRTFSQQNYGGMMERQAKTFNGAMSTIKDTVTMAMAAAFRPLFDAVSSLAVRFSEFVQSEQFTAWAESAASVVGGVLGAFGQLIDAIGTLHAIFTQTLGRMADVTEGILPAIVDFAIEAVGALIDWWNTNLPKLQEILAITLGKIQELVSTVLNAIQQFWTDHGEQIMSIVREVWGYIGRSVGRALAILGDMIDVILSAIKGDWAGAWTAVQRIVARAWAQIIDLVAMGAKAVLSVLEAINNALPEQLRFLGFATDWKAQLDDMVGSARLWESNILGVGAGFEQSGGQAKRGADQIREWLSSLSNAQPTIEKTTKSLKDLVPEKTRTPVDLSGDDAEKLAKLLERLRNAATSALGGLQAVVREAVAMHPASLAAAAAVQMYRDKISELQLAQRANTEASRAMQEQLRGMQEHVSGLSQRLSEAKARLDDLSRPRLTGMGEMENQIAAVQKQLDRLKYAELKGLSIGQVQALFPILTPGMESFVSALPNTREELEKMLEAMRLGQGLRFDEQLDMIGKAAQPLSKELSFEQVMQQIGATKGEIGGLTGELSAAEAAVRAQEAAMRALDAANYALSKQIETLQVQLQGQQDKQQAINSALEIAYNWYIKDRAEVAKLGPEGELAAGQVDRAMASLLASVDKAASDTSADTTQALTAMTTAVQREMAAAAARVGEVDTAVRQIPTYWETDHVTFHRDVFLGANPIPRQHGGPVWPGKAFLVGETGPELFSPSVPGHIMPARQAAAVAAGGNNVTIQFLGPVYGFNEFKDRIAEAKDQLEREGRWD